MALIAERMTLAGYEIEIYQSTVNPDQALLTFDDVGGGGEGEGCALRLSRSEASKLSDALNKFVTEGDA